MWGVGWTAEFFCIWAERGSLAFKRKEAMEPLLRIAYLGKSV